MTAKMNIDQPVGEEIHDVIMMAKAAKNWWISLFNLSVYWILGQYTYQLERNHQLNNQLNSLKSLKFHQPRHQQAQAEATRRGNVSAVQERKPIQQNPLPSAPLAPIPHDRPQEHLFG
jgi:hypothetical protein